MFTDVSGQRICPIFKGKQAQEDLDSLTFEHGTDMFSQNVNNQF
jgi:hypothetical protein